MSGHEREILIHTRYSGHRYVRAIDKRDRMQADLNRKETEIDLAQNTFLADFLVDWFYTHIWLALRVHFEINAPLDGTDDYPPDDA